MYPEKEFHEAEGTVELPESQDARHIEYLLKKSAGGRQSQPRQRLYEL